MPSAFIRAIDCRTRLAESARHPRLAALARCRHSDPSRIPVDGDMPAMSSVRSVVGVFGHDEARAAGDRLADARGKIVGFAAGTGEYDMADFRRHRRKQLFGEFDRWIGQVARVGVERGRLPCESLDHARVAMTDDRHVVVGVEVTARPSAS